MVNHLGVGLLHGLVEPRVLQLGLYVLVADLGQIHPVEQPAQVCQLGGHRLLLGLEPGDRGRQVADARLSCRQLALGGDQLVPQARLLGLGLHAGLGDGLRQAGDLRLQRLDLVLELLHRRPVVGIAGTELHELHLRLLQLLELALALGVGGLVLDGAKAGRVGELPLEHGDIRLDRRE